MAVEATAAPSMADRYHEEVLRQALDFPQMFDFYRRYSPARTAAELHERQSAALLGLAQHVTTTVPAYRNTTSDPIADAFDWLRSLPLVSRQDLHVNLADHCSDDITPSDCYRVKTSGTSGVALQLVIDRDDLNMRRAQALHRYAGYGAGLHRRVLRPFTHPFDDWFEYTSPAFGMARIAEFGATENPADRAGITDRIIQFQPDVVFGFPSRCLELTRRTYLARDRGPHGLVVCV